MESKKRLLRDAESRWAQAAAGYFSQGKEKHAEEQVQFFLIEILKGLAQNSVRDFFDNFLFKLVGALSNTNNRNQDDDVSLMTEGVSEKAKAILRNSGITSGKKVKFYLHPDRCKFGDAQEMFKKFAQADVAI